MTIRFAAARNAASNPLARNLVKGEAKHACNDVSRKSAEAINSVTAAALRHFAEHGLGGASDARSRAELALDAGDMAAFEHWHSICRALDREEATELAKRA